MLQQPWIDGDLSTVEGLAPPVRAAAQDALSPSVHVVVPNPGVHPTWAADVDSIVTHHALVCGYDRPGPVAPASPAIGADAPSIIGITISRPLDQAAVGVQVAPTPSVRTAPATRRPAIARCTATVVGWKRNHRDPIVNTPVLGDAELAAGHRAARAAGFDGAVWLNVDGRVATCDGATVLVSDGGGWVTPPLEDGALDSVWRRSLVGSGSVDERSIEPADVHAAVGVCLVGANGEIASVDRLDDVGFPGQVPPGAVTDWPIG